MKISDDWCLVLRPLNVTARVVLVMKPGKDNYKRPMFDIKVDLDEISLNINRDQVNFEVHSVGGCLRWRF